jgi:predicted permease
MRLPTLLDDFRQDVAFATRTVLRTPGFSVAALSLGLAVGATTAVYSTARWLLDRSPEGVLEPDRLVGLSLSEAGRPDLPHYGFSFPQYEALAELQDAFVGVAAYAKLLAYASTDVWAAEVVHQFVTGGYFSLLGVRPHLGRLIGPEDDFDGAPALAVISHAFWQSRFEADPNVIGAEMRFRVDRVRVIGVLPPEYSDYSLDWNGPTDVWLPMRSARVLNGMPGMLTMKSTFFRIMGRLAPGVSRDQALEMAQRWVPSMPELDMSMFEPNAIRFQSDIDMRISRRDGARAFLGALTVVCLLVLLAAGANVANDLVGRASRRRREMAMRAALGAGRSRIVRQVVTESALLAFVVGAVSVGTGAWIGSWLATLPNLYLNLRSRGPVLSTAGAIDARMFALAMAGGFACAILLGAAAAFGTFRDPVVALRGSGPTWGWGRLRPSARQSVLVLQVGLGVVLTVTAALFARSFQRAGAIDVGIADPSTLLVARVVAASIDRVEAAPFYDQLMVELSGDPGVRSASLSVNPPYAGGQGMARAAGTAQKVEVGAAGVGARFFATHGIDVLAGEEYRTDRAGRDEIIINDVLAERLWPGENAVGRSLEFLPDSDSRVVAVVAWQRCRTLLGPPSPCVWPPIRWPTGSVTVRIRTVGPAGAFLPTLREAVARVSPHLALSDEGTMEDHLGRFTRPERLAALASSALAVFGIALLAVGFVSVFLSMVRESTRELAIRMALGATGRRLVARITGQALVLTSGGLVLGLLLAVIVARGLQARLFEISATDPASYAVAALVVVAVSAGGVAYSARAAVRTAPAENLRVET